MRKTSTNSPKPIWVKNPYTGQRINLEPLFRFNEQPRNPFRQDYPLHRTIMVLANAKMLLYEHGQGNPMNPELATRIQHDLASLMLALGDIQSLPQPLTAHAQTT